MLKTRRKPGPKSAADKMDDVRALIRMIEYLRSNLPEDQKDEVVPHLEEAAKALRRGLH